MAFRSQRRPHERLWQTSGDALDWMHGGARGKTVTRGIARRGKTGGPRPAEDFSRRRAGGRQDLRDAACRRRPGGATAIDVVVGVVEAARPARDRGVARRPRGDPAAAGRIQGSPAGRDGSRRDPQAAPPARARRRARPHQRPRQPASQALSRCRGADRRRHRRLHDPQYPACREPQRRRRPDHPDPRARDGARQHSRPGRRYRGRRSLPRGSDQAPARGQGLCARSRPSAPFATTSRRAT